MGNNDLAIVLGGIAIIGGGIVLFVKGCDLGIKMLCRKSENEPSIGVDGAYPRERTSVVMEYIANQAAEDIDAGTFLELGIQRKFKLKAEILDDFQDMLEDIAQLNDYRLQPLQGRALARYSQLVLRVAQKENIRLNPDALTRWQANIFAGTPLSGNITSGMAITMA